MKRNTNKLQEKLKNGLKKELNSKFDEERSRPPITPKNNFQKKVHFAIKTKQIVVIKAPAGSGKTYLTMGTASDWLVNKNIDKIILTRPAVGMGKTLGMLKGDIDSKFDPFLAPLLEVFTDRYGKGRYETALNAGNIEKIPLEYFRGRNITGVCIADEMQNASKEEVFSLITRVTESGRLFILGDPSQTDLRQESGLSWLYDFVNKHELHDYIEIIEGTSDDIVRSNLCKAFVKAMEVDKYER